MMKYMLVNYFDVWGNEDDGWEVNNLCHEFEVEFADYPSDEEVLSTLIEKGFLIETCTLSDINIEDYGLGDMIELEQADNGCPIGRLELVRE